MSAYLMNIDLWGRSGLKLASGRTSEVVEVAHHLRLH